MLRRQKACMPHPSKKMPRNPRRCARATQGDNSKTIFNRPLTLPRSRYVIAPADPYLAEFAAAADVSHNIDATAVKPQAVLEIEYRPHAVTIAAVSVKQRGIAAVELRAFAPQDVYRNARAVHAHGEFTHRFDVVEFNHIGELGEVIHLTQ